MVRSPALSILVAFRGDAWRTRVWDFLRGHLERAFPEAEIVVATDDGEDPFHKTLAINRAAERAKADVLAIWDADTWVPPENVRAGLAFVQQNPNRWSRPWERKRKLNEEATLHVLGLGEEWDGTVDHRPFGRPELPGTPYWAAPPLLLHREAFEAVGGMDEVFRGWGQEDAAFAQALVRLVGRRHTLPGFCFHLWHPRIGRTGADLWPGQRNARANWERYRLYQRSRTPDELRALLAR